MSSFPKVDGYDIEAVPWRGGELEDEILDLAGHSCSGLCGSFYNTLSSPSHSSLFHSTGSLYFLGTNPIITAPFYFSSLQFLDYSNSHIACLSKNMKTSLCLWVSSYTAISPEVFFTFLNVTHIFVLQSLT